MKTLNESSGGLANVHDVPVLVADGVEKSYRRGVWPFRKRIEVIKGARMVMYPGEIVGMVGDHPNADWDRYFRTSLPIPPNVPVHD